MKFHKKYITRKLETNFHSTDYQELIVSCFREMYYHYIDDSQQI